MLCREGAFLCVRDVNSAPHLPFPSGVLSSFFQRLYPVPNPFWNMDSFTPKQQPESPLKNNPPEYLISLQNHSLERSKFPLHLDITFLSVSAEKSHLFYVSFSSFHQINIFPRKPASFPSKKKTLFFLSFFNPKADTHSERCWCFAKNLWSFSQKHPWSSIWCTRILPFTSPPHSFPKRRQPKFPKNPLEYPSWDVLKKFPIDQRDSSSQNAAESLQKIVSFPSKNSPAESLPEYSLYILYATSILLKI